MGSVAVMRNRGDSEAQLTKLDAVHQRVLRQVRELWIARGTTQQRMVKQTTWNAWMHGASPTLRKLTDILRPWKASLSVEVIDHEKKQQQLPIRVSPLGVATANVVDMIQHQAEQETVFDLVREVATARLTLPELDLLHRMTRDMVESIKAHRPSPNGSKPTARPTARK